MAFSRTDDGRRDDGQKTNANYLKKLIVIDVI